jgi:AraC-like DNA-binding protein
MSALAPFHELQRPRTREAAGTISWSTDFAPPSRRLEGWRTFLAETFPACEVDYGRSDAEFWASLSCTRFGDIGIARIAGSMRNAVRTERQAKAGSDGAVLCVSAFGAFRFRQAGREVNVETGDGYFVHNCLPGDTLAAEGSDYWLISLPAPALAPVFGDSSKLIGLKLDRTRPELRLLIAYLNAIHQTSGLRDERTRSVIGKQVGDLVGTAVGRGRDAVKEEVCRGVRAARYRLARAEIGKRLSEPMLNGERIARAIDVSERYLQRLFEENGTTVTAHILDERLKLARAVLADRARDTESIAAIAYACGFSDVTHFNRSFRRKYGETPSSVRAGS